MVLKEKIFLLILWFLRLNSCFIVKNGFSLILLCIIFIIVCYQNILI
nr:MAG TPA: hypothetical protein [Caudoviricetes sp.]